MNRKQKLQKISLMFKSTAFFSKKKSFANQHIRMISEGSCDTKDWNKGAVTLHF